MIDHDHYRVVEVPDPDAGPRRRAATRPGCATGTPARAAAYAEVIRRELPDGGTVGFLVWGDPALYDSTIRIVESVAALGRRPATDVVPGISSVQLLAARHQIMLTGSAGRST